MKQIFKRLTYANVMSSIAVFLVLGGATAFAAGHLGKNSVGTKQLKKNSVTAVKIKKKAVTGAKLAPDSVTGASVKSGSLSGSDINLSTLGKVPSASSADSADHANSANTANTANSATTAGSVANVHVFKGGAVPAIGNEETSPRVELGAVGPFNFYGKCYEEGGEVNAVEYIELTTGVATLGGEDSDEFSSDSDGYLTPSSPEEDRELKSVDVNGNNFDSDSSDEEFQASASDGAEITGEASGIGAKAGTPTSGNGPFLASNSCIIGAIAVFGG